MKVSQTLRWRVVPIGLLLFSCLWFGAEEGQRAAARVAAANHDYATALQYYAQIQDWSGCGMVMLSWNNVDEAMKYFEAAGDEKGLGLACCKARDYQTALQHFQAANDPAGMGLAYLGLRDESSALAAFTQANEWSGLGLLYMQKRQFAQAEYCFSQVQDLSGLGLVAHRRGDYTKAQQYFEQAKDVQGLGLVALAVQNYPEAIRLFQSINDYSNLGYVYLATSQYVKAYQCFTTANDWNGLGDYYNVNQCFSQARQAFAKDNNPVKVVQSYRNDFTMPDHLQQAIAYGEQSLSSGIMVPEVLLEMADIQYDVGDPTKAFGLLDQAARIQGYASDATFRKGRILFMMGRYSDAKLCFQQVRPDELNGERVYAEAQMSLKDAAVYERLPRAHVQSKF